MKDPTHRIFCDVEGMSHRGRNVPLVFTKRSCNSVVDQLSRLAFDFHENYWLEEVSHQVLAFVQYDVSALVSHL